MLSHDGWYQAASLYHWILGQAAHGRVVVVMPDLKDANGEVQAYAGPVRQHLIHESPLVRAGGFIGLAVAAHRLAKEQMAS